MDLSGSFDCLDHADVLLKFIVVGPEASESDGGSTSSSSFSKSFFVHSVVLLNSNFRYNSYFRVLLRNRWSATPLFGTTNEPQQEAGELAPCNARGLPLCVLKEIFDTKVQAQAAELALRTLYGHEVPWSSDPLLLLQALQVAIGWDATSCVDALADELDDSSPCNISMEFLQLLYGGMPPGLRETDDMKKVLSLGAASLTSRFGIVGDVLRPPLSPQIDAACSGLLTQFCSLPIAAVVAWAASDGLTVASENEVVQLLHIWFRSAQRSPAEGPMLADCLHVCDVTPAYRSWVLPNLEWMPPTLARLLPLVAQARTGLVLVRPQQIPKPWLAPRFPPVVLRSTRSLVNNLYRDYRPYSPHFNPLAAQYDRSRSRSPVRQQYDRSRSRSPIRQHYDRSRSRSPVRPQYDRSRRRSPPRSGSPDLGRSPSRQAHPRGHLSSSTNVWAIKGDDLELLCNGELRCRRRASISLRCTDPYMTLWLRVPRICEQGRRSDLPCICSTALKSK